MIEKDNECFIYFCSKIITPKENRKKYLNFYCFFKIFLFQAKNLLKFIHLNDVSVDKTLFLNIFFARFFSLIFISNN